MDSASAAYQSISIPAPARGATPRTIIFQSPNTFQFPPLREGRRVCAIYRTALKLFQFPPLREGRPLESGVDLPSLFISIPAPARGATVCAAVA